MCDQSDSVVRSFLRRCVCHTLLMVTGLAGLLQVRDIRAIVTSGVNAGQQTRLLQVRDIRAIVTSEQPVHPALVATLRSQLTAEWGRIRYLYADERAQSLVASSELDCLRLWNPLLGQEVEKTEIRLFGTDRYAFAPATRLLAVTSAKSIILHDLKSGKVLKKFPLDRRDVDAIACSADGSLLASGHSDNSIRIWSTSQGEMTREFKAHKRDIECLAFSHDSRMLALAQGNVVSVWEVSSGQRMCHFFREKPPAGTRYMRKDNEVLCLDKEGKYIYHEGHWSDVYCVAFSPNGKLLVSGDTGRHGGYGLRLGSIFTEPSLRIWDLTKKKEIAAVLMGNAEGFVAVAFSKSGQRIISAQWDGAIKVWSLEKLLSGEKAGGS